MDAGLIERMAGPGIHSYWREAFTAQGIVFEHESSQWFRRVQRCKMWFGLVISVLIKDDCNTCWFKSSRSLLQDRAEEIEEFWQTDWVLTTVQRQDTEQNTDNS